MFLFAFTLVVIFVFAEVFILAFMKFDLSIHMGMQVGGNHQIVCKLHTIVIIKKTYIYFIYMVFNLIYIKKPPVEGG